MAIDLLVDAAEFWPALRRDIAGARRSVYLQAMTFEADDAGRPVAEAVAGSAAADRRVLIDEFTRYMVNDTFLPTPAARRDTELQREVQDTRRMVGELGDAGVEVRFTNPVGPLLLRFPLRNHKKLMLIDEQVAYLGGINFSDHNFAWHDLMYRVEDANIAGWLADDFRRSWAGRNERGSRSFGDLELHVTDGRSNPVSFRRIFELIDEARADIFVECPYITFPFIDRLRAARRRGVRVTLVTSAVNNWKPYRDYIPWDVARSGIDLRTFDDRFTHLKSILIDDRFLVVGSPNYDVFTYKLHQEVFAVIRDPAVIADFRARVAAVDIAASSPASGAADPVSARLRYLQLQALGRAVSVLHLL